MTDYPEKYRPQTSSTQYPVSYPQVNAPQMQEPHQAMYGTVAQPGVVVTNELVRAATSLITLITQIRHTVEHPNVASLRAQVVEEVKSFERRLSAINYPVRTMVAARYCLCAAIDEAVLSQAWGTQSVWVQGSLLSIFQKETWGGERFYIILEDSLRDTRSNIDFIELIYFLLSLGFEGKFFGDEHRAAREEIRNRVFYHVRHARTKPERNLSLSWKNEAIPTSSKQRKAVLKRVGIISVLAILVLGMFYNIRVYNAAKPIVKELNNLATVPPITVFGQVLQRPIIPRDNNQGQGN